MQEERQCRKKRKWKKKGIVKRPRARERSSVWIAAGGERQRGSEDKVSCKGRCKDKRKRGV